MKIKAYFLKLDKTYFVKKIDPSIEEIKHEDGLYLVEPTSINAKIKDDQFYGAELFYFEGNPTPIPIKKPKEDAPDPSTKYLDDYIYAGILDQTGAIDLPKGETINKAIKGLLNPANFIKLILMLIIGGAVLKGVLGIG